MKLAILSDTRLPTRRDFAGHGLGQVVVTIAEGLQKRGHAVTLYGAPGSSAAVDQVCSWKDESNWPGDPTDFEAILDSTHQHVLQRRFPASKIVNLSQDREGPPGRCAVYSSPQHRDWHIGHGAKRTGRVVPNGITVPPAKLMPAREPYFLYLANFYAPKGPVAAVNAARLAGVRLVMAGPTVPGQTPPTGAEYIGPVTGEDKRELLAGAKALIYPSAVECSPVTLLEAHSVGTPVICSTYGGSMSNMLHGFTGFACRDTLDMVAAIQKIQAMSEADYAALRAQCIDWVTIYRSIPAMIDGYEAALKDCAEGQVW